jgi:hypothetical protein
MSRKEGGQPDFAPATLDPADLNGREPGSLRGLLVSSPERGRASSPAPRTRTTRDSSPCRRVILPIMMDRTDEDDPSTQPEDLDRHPHSKILRCARVFDVLRDRERRSVVTGDQPTQEQNPEAP